MRTWRLKRPFMTANHTQAPTYEKEEDEMESKGNHMLMSNPLERKGQRSPGKNTAHLLILRTSKKLLSVLVIVPGMSYSGGSAQRYDASALAALGHLVVVTFNYRLGTLESVE
ncbi:hypothetical protein HAZT_HAZT000747 [Hyalella azteca]|uniref:Carboxylesterase type B domain-containing protein n=1 Tax=Hyalella azteca TaxID=294128 RepID=A0A6A0GSA2_HYAAZ|nr:hypothetical protein HAZT_HAZT000747 [Hyalella azteca]